MKVLHKKKSPSKHVHTILRPIVFYYTAQSILIEDIKVQNTYLPRRIHVFITINAIGIFTRVKTWPPNCDFTRFNIPGISRYMRIHIYINLSNIWVLTSATSGFFKQTPPKPCILFSIMFVIWGIFMSEITYDTKKE